MHSQDSALATYLRSIPEAIAYPKPLRLLFVSAHWQEDCFKITSHEQPSLQYDYFGFPKPLYNLPFAPKGDVKFAKKVRCRSVAALPLPRSPIPPPCIL